MQMTCPKCGDELDSQDRGDVANCRKCGGVFVPRGKSVVAPHSAESQPGQASYDQSGGRCPVDHSIMSRAAIELSGAGRAFHLERCPSCHAVWFDAGEWNPLSSEHLLDHLDEFWTSEWRARQRHEHDRREYEARVKEAFGPQLHAQILELAEALRKHSRRSQALAFLREESAE